MTHLLIRSFLTLTEGRLCFGLCSYGRDVTLEPTSGKSLTSPTVHTGSLYIGRVGCTCSSYANPYQHVSNFSSHVTLLDELDFFVAFVPTDGELYFSQRPGGSLRLMPLEGSADCHRKVSVLLTVPGWALT